MKSIAFRTFTPSSEARLQLLQALQQLVLRVLLLQVLLQSHATLLQCS
jgi:hypothetical protein